MEENNSFISQMYARHKQYLTIAEHIKRKLSYKKTALGRFRCSGEPLPLLALVVRDDVFEQKDDLLASFQLNGVTGFCDLAGAGLAEVLQRT